MENIWLNVYLSVAVEPGTHNWWSTGSEPPDSVDESLRRYYLLDDSRNFRSPLRLACNKIILINSGVLTRGSLRLRLSVQQIETLLRPDIRRCPPPDPFIALISLQQAVVVPHSLIKSSWSHGSNIFSPLYNWCCRGGRAPCKLKGTRNVVT